MTVRVTKCIKAGRYPRSYEIKINGKVIGSAHGEKGAAGYSFQSKEAGLPWHNSWAAGETHPNALAAAEAGVAHVKRLLTEAK